VINSPIPPLCRPRRSTGGRPCFRRRPRSRPHSDPRFMILLEIVAVVCRTFRSRLAAAHPSSLIRAPTRSPQKRPPFTTKMRDLHDPRP
jgi:hypothetical protein